MKSADSRLRINVTRVFNWMAAGLMIAAVTIPFLTKHHTVAADKTPADPLLADIEKREKEMLAIFKDEAAWQLEGIYFPKRTLQALKTVRRLRSVALVSVLVPYINWTDRSRDGKIRTVEQRWPVYAAIKSIGIPAVPELIDELKTNIPQDRDQGDRQKVKLILNCLSEIYHQGGDGVKLLEQRLGLEAAKVDNARVKAFLLDAYPFRPGGTK